ncbi:hypothetical protein [Vulcanisaeta distributa]|uniref:hypothetical protein n=1 Tax=Vulcanisaeta distributa TaxID=164451 RepID=UPI0006D0D4B2|nr:hypothetical protein [Vulcanisaeta distributa]
MNSTGLVRFYGGQAFHELEVFGLRRSLPIVPVGDGLWIASDAGLCLVMWSSLVGLAVRLPMP